MIYYFRCQTLDPGTFDRDDCFELVISHYVDHRKNIIQEIGEMFTSDCPDIPYEKWPLEFSIWREDGSEYFSCEIGIEYQPTFFEISRNKICRGHSVE